MDLPALKQLAASGDVAFHPGVAPSTIARFERGYGFRLPAEHSAFLQHTNGIEIYGGYLRLFGVGEGEGIDSVLWNRPDYWKFAWANRCSGFWCFGETAWGDQFAYALDALRSEASAHVYFLEAFAMTPEVTADSFAGFFEGEFLRSAKRPRDEMTKRVRARFGAIDLNTHITYVPSLLLGGPERVENVCKMNARAAMICNGDIAIQLDEGPADKDPTGVETYEDELHRTRLRLVWS